MCVCACVCVKELPWKILQRKVDSLNFSLFTLRAKSCVDNIYKTMEKEERGRKELQAIRESRIRMGEFYFLKRNQ